MLEDSIRPEDYGYALPYKYRSSAEDAIDASRRAFIPIMAKISFLVALYEFAPCAKPVEPPAWIRICLKHKIHLSWLTKLRASQVLDFKCRRVGVIVNFTLSEVPSFWTKTLSCFICAGLLVFINWGKYYLSAAYQGENDLYRPSEKEFEETLFAYHC